MIRIEMLGKLSYYLKKINTLLIMVAFIAGMMGCGTHTTLIEIRDWYDLDTIRNNLGGSYILMNNLNSTTPGYEELASAIANGGKGWQPIGTESHPLTGSFDGQGYEIRDLFVDRPDESYVGFFSVVGEGGVIKDIGAVNATVTGNDQTGGLVGTNWGTVSDSYFTGNVTGAGAQHWLFVGGLVGASNGTVYNSYSTGSVTGTGASAQQFLLVGGLLGNNYGGTVSNSYSTSNVTGSGTSNFTIVGGLVGWNYYDVVSNSYSTGSVTGTGTSNFTYVGGLVGENYGGIISNSYSTGCVTGSGHSFVGGLLGFNTNDGTVSNSYATGNVSSTWAFGGLVGGNYSGSVTNSFWDIQTSRQSTSAGGTGKTTAEMKDITTFSGADWDIATVANSSIRNSAYIWNIVDDETYPFLSW